MSFKFKIQDDMKFGVTAGYVQPGGSSGGGGEVDDENIVRSNTVSTINSVSSAEYAALAKSGKLDPKGLYIINDE
ncbi:MAG: hypothetical protein IJ874_09130 [Ruminococcus sp.]|nr:hypothetical protein [Ruminococcus sp.]